MVRTPRLSLHCLRPVIDWTKCALLLAFALVYSNLASSAFSQTKDIVFSGGGTKTFDGWSNMTVLRLGSLNYGSWPGAKVWTQAITANVTGSGGGLLNRLAGSPKGGGPFPSDASLYFGSSTTVANTLGGTLGVSRAPVSGVRTVVFQIELGEGQPQGQTRYFFHEPIGNPTAGRPTLYVNGQPLSAPTHTALVNQRSTVDGGGENGEDPVFVNTYGYQWNISTSNVTSLEIRFSCVEHVSIYSMRLDQTSVLQSSNVFDAASPAPTVNLSGSGLAFGNVVVGSSKNGTLTISNTGNAPLTVNSITYPSSAFTGSWSGTIAAGASQSVTVTFTPTTGSSLGGNITVSSNATVGTNTIAVSGAGLTRIVGISGSLAFGNLEVGQTAQRTMTISNSGNSALFVSGITYPAGFAGNWSSGTIEAGGSRNVTVTFSPVLAQSYGGTITVNSDRTSGMNTISSSGTGTAAPTRIISMPVSLDFGSSPVGSTRILTLTISNTGNAPLNVSGISYPSGFTGETSGGSIPSGGSRSVSVTFTPGAAGDFGGAISVGSDANVGSGAVSVAGRGTAPAIRQILSGTPQFNGTNTTVTHNFQSTPATWLNVQFTDNLADTNSWTLHSASVYSEGGEFPVTFTKPGDHRANWQRGMFFRLSYPTKP